MFEQAVNHVLAVEGGYVNHPNDPGGETNFGISKRSYPHLDIANLTREQAVEIYRRDYWEALDCDNLPPGIALFAFDAAVNHGVSRAREWLQRADTLEELVSMRLRFYASLDTWGSFGRGWVRRVASLLELIGRQRSPQRLGRFDPVVLHDLTWGDKWQVLTARRPTLRGGFIASRTPGEELAKLDVRREEPP